MMKLCVTATQVYEIAQKTKQKMQKKNRKLSKNLNNKAKCTTKQVNNKSSQNWKVDIFLNKIKKYKS